MQRHIQQGIVDFQSTGVVDEAELPKLVHKLGDMLARRIDHLRERFVTDFGDDALGLAFLSITGQQQKNTSQTFLA